MNSNKALFNTVFISFIISAIATALVCLTYYGIPDAALEPFKAWGRMALSALTLFLLGASILIALILHKEGEW